jgi:hypothetical protein
MTCYSIDNQLGYWLMLKQDIDAPVCFCLGPSSSTQIYRKAAEDMMMGGGEGKD